MSITKKNFVQKLEKARLKLGMSKTRMAEELGTSRSQLQRILDPEENRITLDYLMRAAAVVGLQMDIKISKLK